MKVAIISLGRLGLKVYDLLSLRGDDVSGSFHNKRKNVQNEFFYDFSSNSIPNDLMDNDVVIFNLTPSIIKNVNNFKNFIEKVCPPRFIFISSTSVYSDQGSVDELTIPRATSINGILLRECEELLLNLKHENITILRPGGIYAADIHPGLFLSGKSEIKHPNNHVNLVSRDELASAIVKSIDRDYRIINIVNKNHPTKKEYYTEYCVKNNLPLPIFTESQMTSKEDKIVSTRYSEFIVDSELP